MGKKLTDDIVRKILTNLDKFVLGYEGKVIPSERFWYFVHNMIVRYEAGGLETKYFIMHILNDRKIQFEE